MKTILAPTDFSPISLNAVAYAADLARSVNASLSLIYVCPLPMVISEVPFPPQAVDDMMQAGMKQMEKLKKDIDTVQAKKLKINTEVRLGMVLNEIKVFCEALRPHAVVMGSQGAGAVERFMFGSVTLSAIRNLSYPLIVVPPGGKFETINKIGLACDLKKVAKTFPIDQIKLLIQDFQAELYVIHVNIETEERYNPERMLESADLQHMLEDLHPSYHFLNNTGIDEGLTQFAERNDLDLLIVVPKKHNLIGKIFHKSHSKQLAMHSPVPIMAVHEQVEMNNELYVTTAAGEGEES